VRILSDSNTFGAALEKAGGATSGFEYLRIILAVGVLVFHSAVSTYGDDIYLWQPPIRGFVAIILPMFFALSGFLVTGSYFRSKWLGEFLLARIFRIFPALAAETLLSALLLGVLMTTLPLEHYFDDPLFFRYFLNLIGRVQFLLPGVFETTPFPKIVNQSLWTVPYELECYVALTVVALVGLMRMPKLFTVAVVGVMVALMGYNDLRGIVLTRVEPRLLVVCFLVGAVFYVHRNKIPSSGRLAALSALLALALLNTKQGLYYLSPIPAAYLTVWLGLRTPAKTWIVGSGDYSYGIYLYAFPFQQTCAWLFPNLRNWMFNAGFALALSFGFAFISWNLIEKPFLRLRKRITYLPSSRRIDPSRN
jgi:peptidoglycan/LPS O-acetylase OafA/YrhL